MSELYHHGIRGQKWGVRNGPPYPLKESNREYGKRNLSNSKVSNIDKWGKTENTNTLYISGLSGSGKSTLAESLKDEHDADVIHLDFYLERPYDNEESAVYRSESFDSWLNKNHKDLLKNLYISYDNFLYGDEDGTEPELLKKYIKNVDEFGDALIDYSKSMYNKRKIIVEGVALLDETIYPNKDFFKDKPVIFLQTSKEKSREQAGLRDGINYITDVESSLSYDKWAKIWGKSMHSISESLDCKIGQEYVKILFEE